MTKIRGHSRAIVAIVFFGLIMLSYVVAVFLTFRPRSSGSNYIELVTFGLTIVGGSSVFVLGYISVVILGGRFSLRLVEFTSRLNGSSHAIEVKDETHANSGGLIKDASILYIPVLVLLISLALALNIHYLNTATDITFPSFLSMVKNTLSVLDIFLKPTGIASLTYSIEIIPVIVFFVAVAGVLPSIVLPYLRRFKVTGVNAAPFHKDILFSVVGALFGLTIVFSLVDIIFGVLIGGQPHYYNYVLPTMVGFSLHYSLGAYFGVGKAEDMVEKTLNAGSSRRVFQGKVIIQESPKKEKN